MSLKTTELNLLHKFKQKVSLLNLDIQFLKKCKKSNVFPNFIQIKIPIKNKTTDKVLYNAKKNWLNTEIRNCYSKQSNLELQAMEIHLKIIKNLSPFHVDQFNLYYENMLNSIHYKYKNKSQKLEKKFNELIKNTKVEDKNENVFPNQKLIYNLSTELFSQEELDLLEKGLNFNFKNKLDIQHLIIDVETNIQYLSHEQKSQIRSDIKTSLNKLSSGKKWLSNQDIKYQHLIKQLQEKDVFYLKSDKGNAIVILNKTDYFERVKLMIDQGPYRVCTKNPLNKYTTSTRETIKQCKTLIDEDLRKKLIISNPVIPRLYCLPKIHKPGNQMRPIVSSINCPTYLVSKWLQNKLLNLIQYQTYACKDRYEFINKIKDVELNDDEYFVSFDVVGLYPNVPMDTTRIIIKDWLTSINLSEEEIHEYMMLVNLCTNQTTFSFNGNLYSQIDGTAMGSPLSCILANIFMSHFEFLAQQSLSYFPRVWIRYVDDVFAIFNKNEDINNFTRQLNSIYPSIKFTFEIEINKQLPFLDLLVIKNDKNIEFDIYRKSTHTERYITSDSFHPPQQKRAIFHSLIHRLINTPLSKENFQKELNHIKDVARFNGYRTDLINNMLNKAQKNCLIKSRSTLLPLKTQKHGWISTTFTNISSSVSKTFKINTDKNTTFTTHNNLKRSLKSPKDNIEHQDRSGIYQINCNNCDKIYIGQTRRNLKTRFKEHNSHIKYNRAEKSAVADHCIKTNHELLDSNLKLLKGIVKPKFLNAWETYYINILGKESLMNNENGPIQNSPLLTFEFLRKFI
jgi:hypothetical protein